MSPQAELLAGVKIMGYGLLGVFTTLILLYIAIEVMKKIMPHENDKKKKK